MNLRSGRNFRLIVRGELINESRAVNLEHAAPYFNMSITACRAAGARGGRISGRTRRARLAAQAQPRQAVVEIHQETAHEANMLLDAQFPWLRGAFRSSRRPALTERPAARTRRPQARR